MKRQTIRQSAIGIALAGFACIGVPSALANGYEEFDEFVPIIEINATDGDIGYHVLETERID